MNIQSNKAYFKTKKTHFNMIFHYLNIMIIIKFKMIILKNMKIQLHKIKKH
jgi:hypothetical protein